MEAFFVVVMACLLLGVGVWALTAIRHLHGATEPSATQPRAIQPTHQRRPGDH